MFGPHTAELLLQDYMVHGSQGLFTQVVFNDPSQDDASQSHFGMANANPLHSQVSTLPMEKLLDKISKMAKCG